MYLENKRILITGGTGSLGRSLVHRLLTGQLGRPKQIVVFSRDEAKQYQMRQTYLRMEAATEEVIYRNSRDILSFRIGDVRDYAALSDAVRRSDVVFHTAALKQVPACEYFPIEAVQTNIIGAQNLVRAAVQHQVELVVGISTDKACKPVNVMGMTKALQERTLLQASLDCPTTRFVCVRYGNVVASRGSVVPLFLDQIRHGGPVTVTLKEMTRFLLTLEQAVDTIFAAVASARGGETYIPKVASARIVDVARTLIDGRDIPVTFAGIRPGEKLHEIMVSEEECPRTIERDGYFVILPILPELRSTALERKTLEKEYSSEWTTIDEKGLRLLLAPYMIEAAPGIIE